MPWLECSPVDLRIQFVAEWRIGVFTMTELCAQYGISRKTGYKWIDRSEHSGHSGLADRSRRPHQSPRATPAAVINAIVAVRHRHPTWGARKVLAWLRRHDAARVWPGRTTVADVLARAGLTRERPRHPRVAYPAAPLAVVSAANDTWTLDFKGQFRMRDATECFPLTLRDAFSRFVLRIDALPGTHGAPAHDRLRRAFLAYGLPRCIRTDNGSPFAGLGLAGLSRLAVWWIRLGITPERIDPGCPQQNGAHEQLHAVLQAETVWPPAAALGVQQQRFVRFRRIYNTERPHEALQDRPPADVYEPSPRTMPRRLPEIVYPGHFEIRRVASNGMVSWRNRDLFVTHVLAGEAIGFEPVDDGWWTIHFGHVILGRYDERAGHVYDFDAE